MKPPRLAANVPGDLWVDETCIDCDTCRWMAPDTFDRRGEQSRVRRQPAEAAATTAALQALTACPTGSIHDDARRALAQVIAGFPLPIAGPVHLCGFASPKSFGAASYLIVREAGNVLVDSPRFTAPLVRRLAELGGVATLFLSHADDVADHRRFRERFGCTRVLHRADQGSETKDVEVIVAGDEPVALAPDLLAIPTPGHTAGSMCLLHGDFLFTGDHLAQNPRTGGLYAFRSACWYDWDVQTRSMERLLTHRFEWVLPGHGRRAHFSAERMHAELAQCVTWMRRASSRTR